MCGYRSLISCYLSVCSTCISCCLVILCFVSTWCSACYYSSRVLVPSLRIYVFGVLLLRSRDSVFCFCVTFRVVHLINVLPVCPMSFLFATSRRGFGKLGMVADREFAMKRALKPWTEFGREERRLMLQVSRRSG